MLTGINSEDALVQATFARHLEEKFGWDSIFAWNQETFGLAGTLGRTDTREVVLTRDLRTALYRLDPHLPPEAVKDAVAQLTQLAQMLAQNPLRMDYYRKYSEIVADYNREKGRVTIEETFARLVDLANSLSAEQRRAAEEGLSEQELALFDLVTRPDPFSRHYRIRRSRISTSKPPRTNFASQRPRTHEPWPPAPGPCPHLPTASS